jgi:hypothetical protein
MLTLVFDSDPGLPGTQGARVATRWLDHQGQPFATGLTAGDQRWIDWDGLGVFRFEVSSRTVRFAPSRDVDPIRAVDHFSRIVQPLVLQAQGWPVLHASAVTGPDGAVVFCGLSGSGKSTLAYAVARQPGFHQVADDAVVLCVDQAGTFSVEPIAFRPRLREPAVAHFGPLPSPADPSPADRSASRPIPLHAVVMLAQRLDDVVSPGPEVPLRVPPTSAFSSLLTHAHCFDDSERGAVGRMVETYLAMADSVPVFRLSYRPDFSAIDHLARMIMQSVARPQTT